MFVRRAILRLVVVSLSSAGIVLAAAHESAPPKASACVACLGCSSCIESGGNGFNQCYFDTGCCATGTPCGSE